MQKELGVGEGSRRVYLAKRLLGVLPTPVLDEYLLKQG